MVRFSLPYWFFKQEENLFYYSIFFSISLLPRMLSPIIGGLIDCFNPKKILATCCFFLILASTILFLIVSEILTNKILLIYTLTFFMGIFSNCIHLTILSSISKILNNENFTKGNSLIICAESSVTFICPLIAGFLVFNYGTPLTIFLNISCLFLASIILLTMMNFQRFHLQKLNEKILMNLIGNLKLGFIFLINRKDLIFILFLVAFLNFAFSLSFTFFTPMILLSSNYNAELLGFINMAGGGGQIIGALITGYLTLPSNKISNIFSMIIILGLFGPFLIGLTSNYLIWAIGYAITLGSLSFIIATNNTFWQSNCPDNLQGTIFGIRRMISASMAPLGSLMAVPILSSIANSVALPGIENDYQLVFLISGFFIAIVGSFILIKNPFEQLSYSQSSYESKK